MSAAGHDAGVMDVETSAEVEVDPAVVCRLFGLLVKKYEGKVGAQNECTNFSGDSSSYILEFYWARARPFHNSKALDQ